MFNDLFADVINAVLSSYTIGMKKESLKLSILNSKLEMKDLEIYKYALLQHELPIIVKKGIIRSIKSTIPWKSFMTDPLMINISDIMINCECLCNKDAKLPSKEDIKMIKVHQLEAHESFKSTIRSLLSVVSKQFMNNTLISIVGKAKIQIDRLNVRIEFGNDICTVLGFQIDKMIIDDLKNVKPQKILRGFQITRLRAFIDRNEKSINCSSNSMFFQQMNNSIHRQHEWILLPGDLTGSLCVKEGNDDIAINIKTRETTLDFTDWQIEFLLNTLLAYPNFARFWKAKQISRPKSPDDDSAMWEFVHRAAMRVNQKYANGITNIPLLINTMRRYTSKWPDEPNDNKIKSLDRVLPYRNIVLYRSIGEKLSAKHGHMKLQELMEVVDLAQIDGLLLMPLLAARIIFKFRAMIVNIRLRSENDTEGIVITANRPMISLKHIIHGYALNLSFYSFKIVKGLNAVLESVDMDNYDFNFRVELYNENSTIFTKIDIGLTANNFTLSLPAAFKINFAPNIWRMVQSIVKFIVHPAFKLPPVEISLKTPPLQIFINAGNDVDFLFVLDSFTIQTPVLSERDFFVTAELSNGSLSFGTTKQMPLINNFSFVMNVTKTEAVIDVMPMQAFFDYSYIPMLMSIIPDDLSGLNVNMFFSVLKMLPNYSVIINVPEVSALVTVPTQTKPINMRAIGCKITAKAPELTLKVEAENATIGDSLIANNAVIDISDKGLNMTVDKAMIKLWNILSYLPKDIMKLLPKLSMPAFPINFDMNDVYVDVSVGNVSLGFGLVPFIGKMNKEYTKIDITSCIPYLQVGGFKLIENVAIKAYLGINEIIFIGIDFDPMYARINSDVINNILSLRLNLSHIFPDNLIFNWRLKIPFIKLEDVCQINKIDVGFDAGRDLLFGHLSADNLLIAHTDVKASQLFSCYFDLNSEIFDVFISSSEFTINTPEIMRIVERLLTARLNMPPAIKAYINIQPVTITLVFPRDQIKASLEMRGFADFKELEFDLSINNIQAFINNLKIASIPLIAMNGLDIKVPNFTLDISPWILIRLIEIYKAIPSITVPEFSIPALPNIPQITVSINSGQFAIRQQSSNELGPRSLALNFSSINGQLENWKLKLLANINATASQSWFETEDLYPSAGVKIKALVKDGRFRFGIDMNEAIVATISRFITHSVAGLGNIIHKKPPDFSISNETNYRLIVRIGMLAFVVSPFSSFGKSDIPLSDRIIINNEEIELSELIKGPIRLSENTFVLDNHILRVIPPIVISNRSNSKIIIDNEIELSPGDKSPASSLLIKIDDEEFSLSEKSKKVLNAGNRQLFATLCQKFGTVNIIISSGSYIVNNLPIPVKVSSEYSSIESAVISPKDYLALDLGDIPETFRIRVEFVGITRAAKLKINTKEDGTHEMVLLDSSLIKICSLTKIIENTTIIYLSAPYAKNCTGIPMVIRSTPVPLKSDIVFEKKFFRGDFMVGSSDITMLQTLDKFYIATSNGWKKVKICKKPVIVKLSDKTDTVFPISAYMKGDHIEIVPAYAIVNQTTNAITMKYHNDNEFVLEPGKGTPVNDIRHSLGFAFTTNPKYRSVEINLPTIIDQIIRINDKYYDIAVKTYRNTKYVVISDRFVNSPYSVVNNTDIDIKFRQTGSHFFKVLPKCKLSYVLNDYSAPHILEFAVADSIVTVNIESPMYPTPVAHTGYFVSVNLTLFEGSIITFSSTNSIVKPKPLADIGLAIRSISLKMMEYDNVDIAQFDVKHVNVTATLEKHSLALLATVQSLMAQNLAKNAFYKRVFSNDSDLGDPLITLEARLSGLIKIDTIKLHIEPNTVAIDLAFISAIAALADKADSGEEAEVAVSNNNCIVYCSGEMLYRLIKLLPKNFLECVSLRHVSIEPTQFTLSFQPHVENTMPKYMRCLPAIDSAVMRYKAPIFESNSPTSLYTIARSFSWRALLRSAFSVFKRAEVFGSPAVHLASYWESNDHSFGGSIRLCAVCGVAILDTFSGYISNVLHIALGFARRPKGNRFVWGIFSMVAALSSAMSALGRIPGSSFRGIFVSIAEFLACILSGLIDIIYGTVDFVLVKLDKERAIDDEHMEDIIKFNSLDGPVSVTTSEVVINEERFEYDDIDDVSRNDKVVTLTLTSGREIKVTFSKDTESNRFYDSVTIEQMKGNE